MMRAEGAARYYADDVRMHLHDATDGPNVYTDLRKWRDSEADRLYRLMEKLDADYRQLIGLGIGAVRPLKEVFQLNRPDINLDE